MALFQPQSPDSEIRLSPTQAPRRRGDRETTPGRCGNLDYCSIGMQRVLVQVPVTQPFICPECGGRLRPPGARWRASRPALLPLLRVVVLLVCCLISLAGGYSIGRDQPVIQGTVIAASKTAAAGLHNASAALGLAPSEAPVVHPAPPPAPKPVAPPPPPPPLLVRDVPFPTKMPPAEVTDPPTHLDKEARFGQVTLDCGLDSLSVKPVCKIGDVRGGDAFSKAAQAWLQTLAMQYAPGTRGGQPVLLDHRWRVTFQDFAGFPALPGKSGAKTAPKK